MLFTVLNFLEESSIIRGEKIAATEGENRLTFKELREEAIATAQALVDLGIKPGDRVGVCMNKSLEQILAILGTLYANAIFIPILPSLKETSIDHILTNSGMSVIITDTKRIKEVEAFGHRVKIIIGSGVLSYEHINLSYLRKKFKRSNSPAFERIGIDTAAIIYSSGSTGRPKGIMVSHRNLADGAHIVAKYLGTNEKDRIASILSFNFDYGLNQIWQSLLTGASIHLHELVLPNDCISFLAREKITALPLMPVIISRLFDKRLYDCNHVQDLSSIRYVCSSGGRISSEMIEKVKGAFSQAQIYLMYGLTEAFRSTFLPPDQLSIRPNSIGKPIPSVEIMVLDDKGNECMPGTPGELVHRGGCITKGYWNDEVKTNERYRKHPKYPGEILVYSGDLVTKDADGFITFIGRIDGMLKSYGIRVSPTEVEEVIESYEKVDSCVVFGVENIEVGYDLIAVYTTKNLEPISDSELFQYLKVKLASHMIPRFLVHQQQFPSTGNQGKIDRLVVRENALNYLGY